MEVVWLLTCIHFVVRLLLRRRLLLLLRLLLLRLLLLLLLLLAFARLAFVRLACLPSCYLERASAARRTGAVAVPLVFPPCPMVGWMVSWMAG